MGEYVLLGKAGEIQPHPIGQEAETGGGQLLAPFARQHGVEPLLERMQIEHVGRGIGNLRVGQFGRAPVRRLLLLGKVVSEHFAHEVFEAVLVGIGADSREAILVQ